MVRMTSAQLEKDDDDGMAAVARPARLGLTGWQAQKRVKAAAKVVHGYGANAGDIKLPWANRKEEDVKLRDDRSFDGRSVITNDAGEKEDPMAVLRRFNAERTKIQASPLLRRIDKVARE